MKGLLADVNIQRQVDILVARMRTEPWQLFWDDLQLAYHHFTDVGLAADALDSVVWETCQTEQLILLTDNRNKKGSDSLEATIQSRTSPTSLPVFTIGNVRQLNASRQYADRVIDRLFDALHRIDDLRGAGRLFLP